jgi:predicted  nucleic acid-binding Zn-ribbon protein
VQDSIRLLLQLQQTDTRMLEKRRFIDKVPLRISEVDEPFKKAKAEWEKMKQKAEATAKKKKDKEKALEDAQEKIRKMRARTSDIKNNKEYQAHLKEIESSEKEIATVEEQILQIMTDIDSMQKEQQQFGENVASEEAKIRDFKKELEAEVVRLELDLGRMKEERAGIVAQIDADTYNRYLKLLRDGKGVAVARAEDNICLGCDMNIPPQLSLEIRKGSELVQCPQCYRILYCEED